MSLHHPCFERIHMFSVFDTSPFHCFLEWTGVDRGSGFYPLLISPDIFSRVIEVESFFLAFQGLLLEVPGLVAVVAAVK